METTKCGGWCGEKAPSKSRFGRSSLRYGQFLVLGHRTQFGHHLGAKIGQNKTNIARVDWRAPQTGLNAPTFTLRSNLVAKCFTRNNLQERVKPKFWCFWPTLGLQRLQNLSKCPSPPKTSKAAGGSRRRLNCQEHSKDNSCGSKMRLQRAATDPAPPWQRPVTANMAQKGRRGVTPWAQM